MASFRYRFPAASAQIPIDHPAGEQSEDEESRSLKQLPEEELSDAEQGQVDEHAAADPIQQIAGVVVPRGNARLPCDRSP